MMLNISRILINLIFIIGMFLGVTSCTFQKPSQPLNDEPIGILFPFSKLVSGNVKTNMDQYYDNFETELVSALQKQRVVATPTQYPSNQQPFTYDEMNAPTFTIDPDDFSSPTQILKSISSQQRFSKVIFGHVEEISGSLHLVARIYSAANNKIGSALTQKINIAILKTNSENPIPEKINQLATDIVNEIVKLSHVPQFPNKQPENDLGNDGLFGLEQKRK